MDKLMPIAEIVKEPTRTVAVVVGIETYQYSKPPHSLIGVAYAESDAREVAATLKSQFEIRDEDLYLWINQDATKSRFENDLSYLARSLDANVRFIFYYAGHGFYANSANRLTTWDTHPTSLSATTVCLRDVLLSKLEESDCSQVLLFIDACAVPLDEKRVGRDLLSALNKGEFENFIRSRDFQALFMSCSPGEKSFPSKNLKHGIWTWHLLQALNGQASKALTREEWLTDISLRDYLRNEVEKYIREKTELTAHQKPYAFIHASHTFEILRFEEDEAIVIAELPEMKLRADKAFLRQSESRAFQKLPGFDKKLRHTSPERQSPAAASWASRLLAEEIASESKEVYDNAKSVLNLSRKDIKRNVGEGDADVNTDMFRMTWNTGQDTEDPAYAQITRKLRLRVCSSELPSNFDCIFPVEPNELVIPIEGELDFDFVADGLEALEKSINAKFSEDEDAGRASIRLEDGTTLTFLLEKNELIVTTSKQQGCLALLQHSAQTFASLGRREVATLLIENKMQ
ncbi:MAG: caspase family protein [Desulfuromonadaceae bacterium]|jgi:hypothetical protein|nr:caspase family protein [Desulfuromonadaceae bacterium]